MSYFHNTVNAQYNALTKQAGNLTSSFKDAVEHIAGLVEEHGPDVLAGGAALAGVGLGAAGVVAGATALSAPVQMIRGAYSRSGIDIANKYKKDIAEGRTPDSVAAMANQHPYGLGLGTDLIGGSTGGLSKLVTSPYERAAGIMMADRVREGTDSGIGAAMADSHPFIGSLVGQLPGLGTNRYVAGESIARQVLKHPGSFSYRHPLVASSLANWLPGYGSAWGHALGRIEYEKAKQQQV